MNSITITVDGKQEKVITIEDATNYLIKYLRNPPPIQQITYADYGYELYLSNLLIEYGSTELGFNKQQESMWRNERNLISPLFMDASWELCTRGILRPYTRKINDQGSTNPGFSVTEYGKQWLKESDFDDYVPTTPGRFAEMLSPFSKSLGNSFQARAQEAVKCYNAHAYLACCAMSGAAAETIIMKISEKLGIEVKAMEKPAKIIESITSKSRAGIKERLVGYSDIIKYWRDSGLHHEEFKINSNEAYVSLAMLLRLAMFAQDNWFDIKS